MIPSIPGLFLQALAEMIIPFTGVEQGFPRTEISLKSRPKLKRPCLGMNRFQGEIGVNLLHRRFTVDFGFVFGDREAIMPSSPPR